MRCSCDCLSLWAPGPGKETKLIHPYSLWHGAGFQAIQWVVGLSFTFDNTAGLASGPGLSLNHSFHYPCFKLNPDSPGSVLSCCASLANAHSKVFAFFQDTEYYNTQQMEFQITPKQCGRSESLTHTQNSPLTPLRKPQSTNQPSHPSEAASVIQAGQLSKC